MTDVQTSADWWGKWSLTANKPLLHGLLHCVLFVNTVVVELDDMIYHANTQASGFSSLIKPMGTDSWLPSVNQMPNYIMVSTTG